MVNVYVAGNSHGIEMEDEYSNSLYQGRQSFVIYGNLFSVFRCQNHFLLDKFAFEIINNTIIQIL